jgi:60 kDa SS-A/Ro ribonucleoprotein
MARINVPNVAAPGTTTTYEGHPAKNLKPVDELRRSVMAHMLWEDSFYESGEDAAQRVARLVSEVLPAQVALLAETARTKMKLRHLPLWLAVQLSEQVEGRKLLGSVLPEIIQRPDELTEFLALYWKKGKHPLAKQVKVGLARAFEKFNEYQLAKYNRDDAIKLRDVMFMVHPKPRDEAHADLFKRLAEGKLATPDTWEVELSAGKDKLNTWVRLIAENKLGALALLRNLRNMKQAKVPDEVIAAALKRMKIERVLPFRFISAARAVPQLEPQLEQAMFRCVTEVTRLPGKTALVVDTSASMWQGNISAKSDMTRFEAAAALAILCREQCEQVNVYTFSETAQVVPARRGFALRDALEKLKGGASKGGLAVAMANRDGYDRIIVLTDGQWHHSDASTTNYWLTGMQGDAQVVSPAPLTAKAYMINVANYKRGVGYGKWTSIDGWSEAILDYIAQAEQPLA